MGLLATTAKLNDVNPQAWLADVLDRIGKGPPISRIDELLPWNWSLCHRCECWLPLWHILSVLRVPAAVETYKLGRCWPNSIEHKRTNLPIKAG
jgi:hypothetical protein